jgi:hypothetical protein
MPSFAMRSLSILVYPKSKSQTNCQYCSRSLRQEVPLQQTRNVPLIEHLFNSSSNAGKMIAEDSLVLRLWYMSMTRVLASVL